MLSDASWYIIYTKSRQEHIAIDNLTRQQYQTYLPCIPVHRRRGGNYQMHSQPMFPRYLFIYLDTQDDNWGPIRSTRGVVQFVRFGGLPAKVSTDLIQIIQQKEKVLSSAHSSLPVFRVGDVVRILDGVMAGYQGIFTAKSGATRVKVLLEIVGRAMEVELALDAIGF